eukprot:366573-Chlamydomonas_euryale.AAC.45
MLWNKKLAAKTDAGRVTIQRYAVRVRGVPRDVTVRAMLRYVRTCTSSFKPGLFKPICLTHVAGTVCGPLAG